MNDIVAFGTWLKRRRKALDMTQQALAQRVGCAAVSIRKFESDTQRPSRQLAERLADQLQIAADERPAFVRFARFGVDPLPPTLALPAESRIPPISVSGRALERAPSNLLVPRTTFVGRVDEIAAVGALLLRDDVGLVTLTGPGGVGKTRLAVVVAAQIASAFADGVWAVNLAPVRDPALVANAIAQALHVQETAGLTLIDSLGAALRDKQLLLLLDNLEQVREAGPLLAALGAAAHHCKLLVTSRAPLALSGEYEFPVSPLALPPSTPALDAMAVNQSPAVALFVARAQAVQPGFALTDANAAAVAEICRRLDGLPLAIELAAARSKLLPPPLLLERLCQRLPLLTTGVQDVPERHQTLRKTIAWGYELLDAALQSLFRRLAIFAGGWTLEAAEAVCNGDNALALDVLDGLAILLDHSLLRQEVDPTGFPRFTMLATIQEFALEQLLASGELNLLRSWHAAYFLTLAETAEPALVGADQLRWLARLEAEDNNLRAALNHGSGETVVRLSAALTDFWLLRDRICEGERWLEAAITLSDGFAPVIQANVRAAYVRLMQWRGDPVFVQRLLEESLALYDGLGDGAGSARVQIQLGNVALAHNHLEAAHAYFVASLAYTQAQRAHRLVAWARLGLGLVAEQRPAPQEAYDLACDSLALFRAVGDTLGSAWALGTLARIATASEKYALAAGHQEERLDIERQLNHKEGIASTALSLAELAIAQGQYARAHERLTLGLGLWYEIGATHGVIAGIAGFAKFAQAQGQHERAARLFGAAVALNADQEVSPATLHLPWHRTVIPTAALGHPAAWQAGRDLTLEQALVEALSVVVRPLGG